MESLKRKISFARRLRREQTEVEKILWNHLRDRRFVGRKFRRQQPVGPYIADFICIESHLIVELDGGQHNKDEQKILDKKRTEYLNNQGYNVVRFWDSEVIKEIDGVLEVIKKSLTLPSPKGRG